MWCILQLCHPQIFSWTTERHPQLIATIIHGTSSLDLSVDVIQTQELMRSKSMYQWLSGIELWSISRDLKIERNFNFPFVFINWDFVLNLEPMRRLLSTHHPIVTPCGPSAFASWPLIMRKREREFVEKLLLLSKCLEQRVFSQKVNCRH